MDAGTRLERWALAALLLGLALRAAAPLVMDPWEDAGEYVAMGHALAANGSLWLPSGEDRVLGLPTGDPGFSHHYPPAFPAWLALFYAPLGFAPWVTTLAFATLGVASVLVVWACTRDLFGGTTALLVASLVALEPHLVWATGRGYSESLTVALFTMMTLWAIVRSLKDERWILLAGLFAGLSFLARASLGPFFLVAGLAGFAWRLAHRGLATLRSAWYLLAIALFGGIVAAWSLRNVLLFGWPRWETSPYLSGVTALALRDPILLAAGFLAKLAFLAALLGLCALPFAKPLRAQARRWREEEAGALMLAVVLVLLLAALVTAALWMHEPSPLLLLDHHRYVLPALPPLLRLAMRDADPARAMPRWGVLALAMALVSVAAFVSPQRDSEARAAEFAATLVHPGDRLGMHDMTTYEAYPFVAAAGARPVMWASAKEPPELVLGREPLPDPSGYVLVGEFHQRTILKADRPAWLYARADVAAARGILTNLTAWVW